MHIFIAVVLGVVLGLISWGVKSLVPVAWHPAAYWAIHLSYTFLAGGFIGRHCSDNKKQNPALILFLVYVFFVVPPWAIVGTVFGFSKNPFEPPDSRYGVAPAIIMSNLITYLVAFGIGYVFFEWKKKR